MAACGEILVSLDNHPLGGSPQRLRAGIRLTPGLTLRWPARVGDASAERKGCLQISFTSPKLSRNSSLPMRLPTTTDGDSPPRRPAPSAFHAVDPGQTCVRPI